MAQFLLDTFTDTDGTVLSSHTGETGATWTEHPNQNASDFQIQTNRARSVSSGSNISAFYASGTPAGTEYDVNADMVAISTDGSTCGIIVRVSTSAHTWYLCGYTTSGTNRYYIEKLVAGTATEIGSNTSLANWTTGVTQEWLIEVRTGSIRLVVDGVEKAAASDTDITAAGRVGMRGIHTGSTTGPRFDAISADDVGGGGPTEIAGTDTQALTGTDAASLVLSGTIADTQALTLTETAAIARSSDVSDSSGITADDAAALLRSSDVADTQGLATDETAAVERVSTVTDTQGLGATETASLLIADTLEVSDTQALGLTDSATLLTVDALEAADTQAIGLTDTAALVIAEAVTASDTQALAATDAATVVVTLEAADTAPVALTEAATLVVALDVIETPALTLSEVVVLMLSLSVADTQAVGMADSGVVEVGAAGIDVPFPLRATIASTRRTVDGLVVRRGVVASTRRRIRSG